jgi:undecaprenyl diphosphate synthase
VPPARAITGSCLTVYAFSSDNWRRPTSEVQGIFWLLRAFLRLETERLRQRGARLQVVGRRDRLAKSVLREVEGRMRNGCSLASMMPTKNNRSCRVCTIPEGRRVAIFAGKVRC